MDNRYSTVVALGEKLQKHSPVLHFLVKAEGAYSATRRWGDFDRLGLRAIDDLAFAPEQSPKVMVAFTTPPPHAADSVVVSIPTVVALERIFFHIQEVARVEVNPRALPAGAAPVQAAAQYTLPESFDDPFVIERAVIPELLGRLSTDEKGTGTLVQRAAKALQENLLFESFYLAREARRRGGEGLQKAWFYELWSFSFLGLPEEALALYEEYPERGSPDPFALLLSGRYRLLLKQFNEARTILHTLSFMPEVGPRAECELARSFVSTGEFARAIDLASSSIKRDSTVVESYLVRGIAQRGAAYSSGDEEGLKEALRDVEHVATLGGFHAPEASFHAGTIFARLGDLDSAERSLRQSLFQRDRFSTRDALIRVLAALSRWTDAQDECAVLSPLAPQATKALSEELQAHIVKSRGTESSTGPGSGDSGLRASGASEACAAALVKLHEWRVPVANNITDIVLFDDFINRFAPAGEFIDEGEFATLANEKLGDIARVIALHVAHLLEQLKIATIDEPIGPKLSVSLQNGGHKLQLESLVEERILLGAAGDNVSSLESLLADAGQSEIPANGSFLPTWWVRADDAHLAEIQQLAEESASVLKKWGAQLHGTLSDLEEIDRVVDAIFEPGGKVENRPELPDSEAVARFVAGAGLLVGRVIAAVVPSTWFSHTHPEGVSLFSADLGRVFPIAKAQRRIYLASAADYSTKFGSLALGVAAAAVLEKVRVGACTDAGQAKAELLALFPSLGTFSSEELDAVVQSLLMSGSQMNGQ